MSNVEELLKNALTNMADKGMIFSKEIQFQFALATELKEIDGATVLLENLSVLKDEDRKEIKVYTDLVLQIDGFVYPIELKYKTADRKVTYKNDGNYIYTFNQGAVESGSYDFIKDINRIELLLDSNPDASDYTALGKKPKFKGGFTILLTNYSKYYETREQPFYWENYHLSNKKEIRVKKLSWKNTDKVSKKAFENRLIKNLGIERATNPITLKHTYKIQWEDYNPKGWAEEIKGKKHNFKYLLISVPCNTE